MQVKVITTWNEGKIAIPEKLQEIKLGIKANTKRITIIWYDSSRSDDFSWCLSLYLY